MVLSMTGFARKEVVAEWGTALWELRSVNSRYLEISPRLPEDLRSLDTPVREHIRNRLRRGKVDCVLRFVPNDMAPGGFELDRELATKLVSAAGEVEALLPNAAPLRATDILRWPGVIQSNSPDLDHISQQVLSLLDETVEELVATRAREGERIAQVLRERCEEIAVIVEEAQKLIPEVLSSTREKLKSRLADLQEQLDPDRIEQEIVIIAQKIDVTEELDRLRTHVEETLRVMERGGAVGRRLDFLMQEMNREANTLGSKSAHTDTTRASVDLKVLIEQLREQMQNLE